LQEALGLHAPRVFSHVLILLLSLRHKYWLGVVMRSSFLVLLLVGCANESPIPDAGLPPPVDAGGTPVEPSVQVFPVRATVLLGQRQQLAALVTGLEDSRVLWSVEGTGGVVSAEGLFEAGSTAGTVVVRATSAARPNLSNTAAMTVVERMAPAAVRVALSPTNARLSVGGTLQLTATVTGASDPAVSWSATGGTVSATGLFTAPDEPGFVAVRATSVEDPRQSATATLIVNDVVTVSVTPAMAALELGAQAQFQATVTGAPTSRVVWSATGGSVSDGGLFTGTAEGDFLVTAESVAEPMQRASAMVNVSPIRVVLSPTPAPTLDTVSSQQFFAQVSGTSNPAITWSATGGTIDSNGLFLAGTAAGPYSVRATSVANPTRFAQVMGTVRPVTVMVSPAMSALRVGTTRQFQALVQGSSNQAVTWSVETPGGGSISATGLYTAPAMPGVVTVKATSVVDTSAFATAVVAVQTAPIISVSITSPTTTQSVPQGGTLQFTAQIAGATNTGVTWTSTGGTISSTGLFAAPVGAAAAGSYTVTATSQADPQQSASATVLVPPIGISISPMTATVVAANSTNATPTSRTFSATVTGAASTQVTWSVREPGGGTIASGGTYQAPAVPGTYTVVARSTVDPTAEGTARVTVTPVPVVVAISPRNPTVGLGSVTSFSATVANAVTPGVVWSIADGGVGGRVDAQGNYTAPPRAGVDTLIATSQQDTSRSDSTSITVCNSGAVCVPSNVCRTGNISCSTTGGPTCVETTANAPNGTPCGSNQVCNAGQCATCMAGGSCMSPDPCAVGVVSCSTGSPRCESAGPNPARPDGTTCSPTISGLCQSGRCQCTGNATFVFGDCQTCPAFTDLTVRVNADPLRGADNACCGRTSVTGLGGPCLTIRQAMRNVQGSGWTIHVTPDVVQNLSAAEVYPIELSRGVFVNLGGAFAAGRPGVPVFVIKDDSTTVTLQSGTVGVSSARVASGASAGVRVFSGDGGTTPNASLFSLQVESTQDGIQVESGGRASMSGTSMNLVRIANAGVSCQSTLRPDAGAQVSISASVESARYGLFASTGCSATGSFRVGPNINLTSPCPLPRPIEHGVWLEGTAVADLTIQVICSAGDGVSLRTNPLLPVNAPIATVTQSFLARNGCAGIYAETGRVTVRNTTIRSNHFGVYASSTLGGSNPLLAPINLNGGGGFTRNTILCNQAQTNGLCSVGTFASRGFDVFNNTGFLLDASNTNWGFLPMGRCDCDSTLTTCSCAGAAFGLLSPPDGLAILNAPLLAGSPTTPSVITTNFALASNPVCP
jgi:hypothetical protein